MQTLLHFFVYSMLFGVLSDVISQVDTQIYRNMYGSYCIPLKMEERPAVALIKEGKVYERETLKYIEKIYKKGTSIVHAGAFFGDMLPFFSKLVESEKIWSFEPSRLNFFCAKNTLDLNNIQNVKIFNWALSNVSEVKTLRVLAEDGSLYGGKSFIIQDEGMKNELKKSFEKVKSVTLDEVLMDETDEIGIIHLDVERHELEALKGAKNTIEKFRPVIILETHSELKEKISDYMKSINYLEKRTLEKNGRNTVYFPLEYVE